MPLRSTRRRTILVLHLAGQYPLGGIGWQAIHHLVGLARLGHNVYYVEDSGAPPYDPRARSVVVDHSYGVDFIRRLMERAGLGDRWAYVDVASSTHHGLSRAALARLYERADALVNVCATTRLREEHMTCPVRIYLQTDPVHDQILAAQGVAGTLRALEDHTHHFTYGENLGAPDCPVPLVKFRWQPTRPPVVLDFWPVTADPGAARFTTVATWRNVGKDVTWDGVSYQWSKHDNFQRVLDLPRRVAQPLELALESADSGARERLRAHGWLVTDALSVSRDLDGYRDYLAGSRGEFTVAKDLVVRTRSGWFSDRSACYLAAGRPVVTQDTGFGAFVPTGEGLFGFSDVDEAAAAIEAINRDYPRHSAAARRLAAEYFDAEAVLERLCSDAGL